LQKNKKKRSASDSKAKKDGKEVPRMLNAMILFSAARVGSKKTIAADYVSDVQPAPPPAAGTRTRH
jgi:hypothetical protein